ncbi:uncharacterized protein (TIGR02099 family) [Kushneria sinocarnis]|uniref:Uncharacterized protein (TIGR02099 family) n=1 Tax=Kushneria sinocarnis TaxID=595502 RepID=A0A420WVF1_9GAMM|nr:AsmA-like C-terminal region-containing protein [Kushneria sinocarnis]RKR02540.1 uncharacterized protein (TIGR02099 family) [Kushneria sinocarnis]
MVLLRTIARWSLMLLAALLTLLAATVVALRMGALDQPDLQRHLLEALGLPDRLMVHYDDLDITLEGLDVIVSLEGAHVGDRQRSGRTLLGVTHLQARLDTLASLRHWQPVTTDVVIREPVVELYRLPEGGWGWWSGRRDTDTTGGVTPAHLTGWVEQLIGQRGALHGGRLTFHDGQRQQTLMVPRLAITHSAQGAHLQGSAHLQDREQTALRVVGEFDNRHALTGRLQLTVDAGESGTLGRWLLAGLEDTRWHLDRASGRLRLWAGWQQGSLEQSRFDLALADLEFGRGEHAFRLASLAGRGLLERDGEHWRGWINQLKARPAGSDASLLPPRLSLSAAGQWDEWHFNIAGFELAPLDGLLPLLPLEGETRRSVEHLDPTGRINGVAVDFDGQWHFRAGLVGVTTRGRNEVPGLGPVDGWLSGTPRQGSLRLSGSDTTFELPGVFPTRWQLAKLHTRLTWQGDADGYTLRGRDLQVERDGATARGSFAFLLPRDAPERFNLDLELRDVQGDRPRDWLPLNALDPEARQWLSQHLHRADVPRASVALRLVFNGDQAPDRDRDRVRVSLEARRASVDYLEDWPALTGVDGHIDIRGETIDARIDHANLNGLVSRGARVHLGDNRLTASAAVHGDAGAMLDVLKAAPLDASLADTIASWRAHGPLTGMLNVEVPLEDSDAARVDGNIRIDRAGIYFRQSDLTVTDVSGRLAYRYRNEQSDVTGDLTARVFDSVSKVHVDLARNRITARGHAMAAGVAGWLGIETVIPLLSGGVDYSASLDLEAGGPIVHVNTDLAGLSLRLPPPFQKAPDRETPLSLEVNLGQGSGKLQVADRVRARWRHDSRQGQVWLQHWPSRFGDWPTAQHWEVYWQAERIDMQAWQTAIARLSGQSSKGPSMRTRAPAQKVAPIEHIVIRTDCLSLGVQCIGSLGATANARGNDWHAEMAGSFLKGSADWRDRPDLPLRVRLSRLDIAPFLRMGERSRDDESEGGGASGEATDYAPGLKSLPPGRITIDRLLRDEMSLGNLSARWQASDERLELSSIVYRLPDATITGRLDWEASGSDRSLTRARLDLDAGDLGKTLKSFSLPDAIRTESGRGEAKLAWPGAPWQFALDAVTGRFDVELGNGRITAINSDLARVVSLLNLDNLFERLRLNFSDVTHSGISFRSLEGAATLHDGRLQTLKPIRVAGSATRFTLAGQVDLLAQTLDGQLGVTVPVTQNLPLAAVAIGAPQVGGVLWLFHQLFEPWLSRVSRIYYHVWGPWASPQIKLEDAQ